MNFSKRAVPAAMCAALACTVAAGVVGVQAFAPTDAGLVRQAEAKAKVGAKGYYSKDYSYNRQTQIGTSHWVEIRSFKKKTLKMTVGFINSSYISDTRPLKVKIKNCKGSFRYMDSFEHRGKGSIRLGRGWVKIKITPLSSPSRGMLTTGGKWIKLKKR